MSSDVLKWSDYLHKLGKDIIKNRWLYVLLAPGIIWFIIYRYLPMFGLYIAFSDFSIVKGITGSEFVGLKYFKYIFFEHRNFWQLVENTLAINILKLVFYFPTPIIFALMLNEILILNIKNSSNAYISSALCILGCVWQYCYYLLSPSEGIVNQIMAFVDNQFFMSGAILLIVVASISGKKQVNLSGSCHALIQPYLVAKIDWQ